MKFAIKKSKLAEDDIIVAAVWHDEQVPGLGDDFLNEADAAVASLIDNPLIHSIRFDDVRCVRLKRFNNYGVYYLIKEKEIWVVAVLHGAREVRNFIQSRK